MADTEITPADDKPFVSVSTEADFEHDFLPVEVISYSADADPTGTSNAPPLRPAEIASRPVARRDRPLSSLLFWSDAHTSSTVDSLTSVDLVLERKLLRGVSRLEPPAPSWRLNSGGRQYGTVTPRKRERALKAPAEGATRRAAHLSACVTRTPALRRMQPGRSRAERDLLVFHNALRIELRDLYTIASSMSVRRYDVNDDDVRSMFAWFGVFGDMLRLYFSASERFLLADLDRTTDMEMREDMSPLRRKATRLSVVSIVDQIDNLKRPMQARLAECGSTIPKLVRLVDDLAIRLMRHLHAEMEQLPYILESHFHEQDIRRRMSMLENKLLEGGSGMIMLAILAYGTHETLEAQRNWLRERLLMHQTLLQRGVLGTRGAAQRTMKRFTETHKHHVTGFAAAEAEYYNLFSGGSSTLN